MTNEQQTKRGYEIKMEKVEKPIVDGRAFIEINGNYYQFSNRGNSSLIDLQQEQRLLLSIEQLILQNPNIAKLKIKLEI